MYRKFLRNESGQNLVLLVGGILLLFAVLAVAMDMGNIYLTRRKMQNAADAGALAGAQYLCRQPSPTESGAQSVALQYAVTKNGAASGLTTATVNMTDYTVTVNAARPALSFAAQVFGIGASDVPAVAKAACGVANGGCGLWPIAFDIRQWNPMVALCTGGTDPVFYVWAAYHNSSDPNLREAECRTCCESPGGQATCDDLVPRPSPPCDCERDWDKKAPDCTLCNCEDPRGGGTESVTLITDVGRAWLDFSSQAIQQTIYPINCSPSRGCGANELACWIKDNFSGGVRLGNGICIDGDTGVKAGVKDEIDDRAGDIVQVPIFDGNCTEQDCADGFNVVKLGCINVIGWEHNVVLDYRVPPRTGNPVCWKGKLIKVSVACAGCTNTCAGTDGSGPPTPGGARGISLIQ